MNRTGSDLKGRVPDVAPERDGLASYLDSPKRLSLKHKGELNNGPKGRTTNL
jgi:hypothetical protein